MRGADPQNIGFVHTFFLRLFFSLAAFCSRRNQGFTVASSTDEITTFAFEMAMDPLEGEIADGQPPAACLVQRAVIPSDGQDCVKSEVWIGPLKTTRKLFEPQS